MKIVVSAESTIDLTQELLDKYNIKTVNFRITMGDKTIDDGAGVSSEIFDYVKDTNKLPKTSAVSPDDYRQHFEKLREEYDAVIHISLSSLMSSAYNNAYATAQGMDGVYVIDSRTLSTGIALLGIYASDLIEEGYNAEQIVEMVKAQVEHIQAGFILEKLNYLYKGGRCSAVSLLGANILKIKPQIIVKDGRMTVGRKYIGNMRKCAGKYLSDLLEDNPNANLDMAFITRSSEIPEIDDMLEEMLKNYGFKQVYKTLAGGTISSHCGPNCVGVLFINK